MVEKMSFMIEHDSVLVKYNEIWNKIKKTLNIKFHSMPVYDEKYIKTKVKEFNGVVNVTQGGPFWGWSQRGRGRQKDSPF